LDPKPLVHLSALLSKLPGVGKKSAMRLAYHFLGQSEQEITQLIQALSDLKSGVSLCETCFALTDKQPCDICADPKRDAGLLCVVASPTDVAILEKTGAFNGRYHVLHGLLSPSDSVGPESLKIRELLQRAENGAVREVILATSPTREGEATAAYLAQLLAGKNLIVTRIAHGVPMGALLEYADEATLGHALSGRREV